jgi:hypothetical protein
VNNPSKVLFSAWASITYLLAAGRWKHAALDICQDVTLLTSCLRYNENVDVVSIISTQITENPQDFFTAFSFFLLYLEVCPVQDLHVIESKGKAVNAHGSPGSPSPRFTREP